MRIKAYGKVNLALDITGRLSNGYHNLNMIMQTINIYDLLDIELIHDGIEIVCDKKYIPIDKRNTVYKAAELLINNYNIKSGLKIYIKKVIPSQAGLGGGSSDAAAVIKSVNKLFHLKLSNENLINIGKEIGADVPFFIYGGTARCQGIGEKVTSLRELRDKYILLVKPDFGVSTKEAYNLYDLENNTYHPDVNKVIKAIEEDNIYDIASNMGNVLECIVIKIHPEIERIKSEFMKYGALASLMTGSGSAVFALFENKNKGISAYSKMKNKYRYVFLTKTI